MNRLDEFKRTVLLAKRMLIHSWGHSVQGTILDRLISIHDMHSAVEWLLVGVHTFYVPEEPLPESFPKLIKRVGELIGAHTGNKLILAKDMERLAYARNDAQHRAEPPSHEELPAHYARAESFFKTTLEAMKLDISFDNLSLADLISTDFIIRYTENEPEFNEQGDAAKIVKASREINVHDSFGALEEASRNQESLSWVLANLVFLLEHAFKEVEYSLGKQMSPSGTSSTGTYGGISSVAGLFSMAEEFRRLFPIEFGESLTQDGAIRRLFESLSSVLVRMTLGIDLADYHRLDWLEHKLLMEAGEQMSAITWTEKGAIDREAMLKMGFASEEIGRQIAHTVSHQEIQWVLDFGLECLLKCQGFISKPRL